MAAVENVELVRLVWDRFQKGEVALEFFEETVEVNDHDVPESGVYRGHEGLVRWLEDWGSVWSEWTVEPKDFIDAGEQVVAVFDLTATGKGSGVELTREDAIVHALRGGKIARLDYFNDRAQAMRFAEGTP
jgi:ketosteroid isomerase-like protein